MIHTSKKLAVTLATLALTFLGMASAQAADLPLTYTQFVASEGYKDLQAAADRHTANLATATGINIDLEITSASTGTIQGNVKATRTAAKSTVSMFGETVTVSFHDGFYYLGIADAVTHLKAKNSSSITKRLPSSSVKQIKIIGTPAEGSTLIDMNPSAIFSGESTSGFVEDSLGLDLSNFTFGEIVKTANPADPTSTDYITETNMVDAGSGIALDMVTTQTFNAEGLLTVTLIEQDISLLGMSVSSETKLTQTIDNTLVLAAPSSSAFITSAKFTSLDRQISAEATQKTNASKIVTKAKALAKAAKKTLAGSHVSAAAKALKISSKSVTNGVKLTGKYMGVTGYLCVTAVKGVATTKNC